MRHKPNARVVIAIPARIGSDATGSDVVTPLFGSPENGRSDVARIGHVADFHCVSPFLPNL
ncbi:hypothetical protein SEA_FAUST_268 [Streptomyces phage Faust]|uniref:Uncharacterized protein n=1 Tax=Streptomyces phage Faust TaxID=2767565 RepID=A0A7G9UZ85_9CAUD|nr:hypothetical protein PP456_gp019 [Streptomyces phage Faust]QNN99340.1 hypothetical protein SEA_FAUST_268 [Streptomyces phage Faust]